MLIKFFQLQFRDLLLNSARGSTGKTFCNLFELESLMVLYHCMVVNVVNMFLFAEFYTVYSSVSV